MEHQNTLTGRYHVRLKSRRDRTLVIDRTDSFSAANTKAQSIQGVVYDSQTDRVYSPQTGTWLKPITQDVIDQELEKHADDQDYHRIAVAIGHDMLEGSVR